ncbi:hypothetical protein Q3H59_004891 [Pantoea sp. SORGH_AS 659]|nr:hypothetical protein [Pantoea sp. SORGH_AS_0659]
MSEERTFSQKDPRFCLAEHCLYAKRLHWQFQRVPITIQNLWI